MARSKVELFEQIRRDKRIEALSIRELAERHRVHRRTVRQALASALPPPRKAYPRRPRPAIDPYSEVIDSWLLADRDMPRKQRHTARRVWQRLVAEHGATLAHTGWGVLANEGIVWQLSSKAGEQTGLEGIVTTPLKLSEDTFQPILKPPTPTQRTDRTGPPWYYYPPGIDTRVELNSSLAVTLTTHFGLDSTPLFAMHTTNATAWILHNHHSW